MTTGISRLRSDDPLAAELTAAIKGGEAERLRALLAAHPELARCVVEDAKGGGRTPLHLLADWPGHNPNAAAVVQILTAAGAALDHAEERVLLEDRGLLDVVARRGDGARDVHGAVRFSSFQLMQESGCGLALLA